MKDERKIAYEPHPVTPERKAELVAGGFKILDARFAPKVDAEPEVAQAPEPMKRKRKNAAAD